MRRYFPAQIIMVFMGGVLIGLLIGKAVLSLDCSESISVDSVAVLHAEIEDMQFYQDNVLRPYIEYLQLPDSLRPTMDTTLTHIWHLEVQR